MRDAEAALQYLVWALEEIKKIGNKEAAHHARRALEEVRGTHRSGEADIRYPRQ